MKWFLYESFAALSIALFLLNFALLVYWRRGGRARPLLVGLGASAALLTVQGFVVTQREHAALILGTVEVDVRQSNAGALEQMLSSSFRCESMDRKEFVQLADSRLSAIRVFELRRTLLEVDRSEADRFAVIAVYWADLELDRGFRGLVKTRWRIAFAHEGGAWKIDSVEILAVNDSPVSSVRNVGR